MQIGNFLADNGAWTSMTLMSDYLHNAPTPDRQASNIQRHAVIARAAKAGNTIHIYGTNDDNYSKRRGSWPQSWQSIPNRQLFLNPEDFEHWQFYFTECRNNNLNIVLWLWPNDARNSYNHPAQWSDQQILEQMMLLITLGNTPYRQNDVLVKDYVLKLEADDEWSIPKINKIAAQVKQILPADARLWYHNQTTDLKTLQQIDWNNFDGIRYQFRARTGKAAIQNELIQAMEQLPGHLLWIGSEYTMDGESPQARQIGDWILELKTRYPAITGVDNGCNTPERYYGF